MFGNKVKAFQKKLDDHKVNLISPVPSPDVNAPSPSPDSDIDLPDDDNDNIEKNVKSKLSSDFFVFLLKAIYFQSKWSPTNRPNNLRWVTTILYPLHRRRRCLISRPMVTRVSSVPILT